MEPRPWLRLLRVFTSLVRECVSFSHIREGMLCGVSQLARQLQRSLEDGPSVASRLFCGIALATLGIQASVSC